MTAYRPTRAEIDALQVGQLAPDCFGRLAEVKSIYARSDDINGKRFVCYYTVFGSGGSTCSMSQKEGEVSRDAGTCRIGTSAEIDAHDLK